MTGIILPLDVQEATNDPTLSDTCEYHEQETGFVYAIGYRIIREAKRANTQASELMDVLFDSTDSWLVRHARIQYPECYQRMIGLLDDRLYKVDCPSFSRMVAAARIQVQTNKPTTLPHIVGCVACRLELRELMESFPYLPEFR